MTPEQIEEHVRAHEAAERARWPTLMADAKSAGFTKFGLANKILGAPDSNSN